MSRPSRCQGGSRQDAPTAASVGDPPVSRRIPQQQRGRETRDALLDATATLLDEVGYDALTTKAVALRAGVSIGAFYQFFENKDAAVNDLVGGYRAGIRSFLTDAVSRTPSDGINVAWTRDMISGLGDIYRNLKGFRGVWGGRFANGPLDTQARALRQEVLGALDEGFAEAFPHVAVATRQRCLTMTLDTATLLLGHAVHPEVVHDELHRLLGLYLAFYFSPARPLFSPIATSSTES